MKDEAWDKARPDLTFAIKFAKDDSEKSRALYQQGKASAESGKEIDLGIKSLIQAMPIADEQYEGWVQYRLAQLYVHNKELNKAKETLTNIENAGEDDDLESKVKKLKKKLKKLKS
jgi:predicted negative regulator of RcsB-dependent stress response